MWIERWMLTAAWPDQPRVDRWVDSHYLDRCEVVDVIRGGGAFEIPIFEPPTFIVLILFYLFADFVTINGQILLDRVSSTFQSAVLAAIWQYLNGLAF
jgi:hypothetical protein